MKVCHLSVTALWLVYFAGLILPLTFPGTGVALELTVQSDTIVRSFERADTTGADELVFPGYEYLQVDIGRLTETGLSLHVYGWGRHDFADSEFYTDTGDAELLYGYLEYTHPQNNLNARLGRQSIFEGVANETVDGLRLSLDLGRYFRASAYTGQPVGLNDTVGRSGDSIFGGRIAVHRGMLGELGLSYKNSENDGTTAEEMFGIDSAIFLPLGISLYGNSVRNMETSGWSEHNYAIDFSVGDVTFRPSYAMYEYASYFAAGANAVNPFRILAMTGTEVDVFGLEVTWLPSSIWTLGGKFKNYDDNNAVANNYYSALAAWHGEALTEIGGEIGILDGDLAKDSYLLLRLYGYWDGLNSVLPVDFTSADLVYVSYDQEIYGQDYSFFASVGLGKSVMTDALTFKLSADFSADPYFDDDLRGMLSMNYKFDYGR